MSEQSPQSPEGAVERQFIRFVEDHLPPLEGMERYDREAAFTIDNSGQLIPFDTVIFRDSTSKYEDEVPRKFLRAYQIGYMINGEETVTLHLVDKWNDFHYTTLGDPLPGDVQHTQAQDLLDRLHELEALGMITPRPDNPGSEHSTA